MNDSVYCRDSKDLNPIPSAVVEAAIGMMTCNEPFDPEKDLELADGAPHCPGCGMAAVGPAYCAACEGRKAC